MKWQSEAMEDGHCLQQVLLLLAVIFTMLLDVNELVEEVHWFKQGQRSRSTSVVDETGMPKVSVPSSTEDD